MAVLGEDIADEPGALATNCIVGENLGQFDLYGHMNFLSGRAADELCEGLADHLARTPAEDVPDGGADEKKSGVIAEEAPELPFRRTTIRRASPTLCARP